MTPKLSILIPSLISRGWYLQNLLGILYNQDSPGLYKHIRIHVDVDNAAVSIGRKRNDLLRAATGEYVIFIDDDDEVSKDYLAEVFKGIEEGVDHVGICGMCMPDNNPHEMFRSSKHFNWEYQKGVYYRNTNHLCAIKREIALQVEFPDFVTGEDKWYSDRISPLIGTEYLIERPVYFYKYRSKKKDLGPEVNATM